MADSSLAQLVTSRIHRLTPAEPVHPTGTSAALLAQLRRAVARPAGSVPEIWGITSVLTNEASAPWHRKREEEAVHLCLCLFAIHQQSRPMRMHTTDRRFGGAVRLLADHQGRAGDADPHETSAYVRLMAAASSTQLPTLVTHIRGLVTQLRSSEIAFDYGALAMDLVDFQDPRGVHHMRQRWGRDFHRLSTSTTAIEPDQGDQS